MKMFYATSLLSNRLQIKYKETVVFFEIIFGIRGIKMRFLTGENIVVAQKRIIC